MSNISPAAVLWLAALTIFPAAHAQVGRPTDAPAANRDPADPKAAVPPGQYTSAFERYRPNAEVEVGAWRLSNDTVGRIGGWRIYGREAIADAPASAPSTGNGRQPGHAPAKPAHGQHR